MLTGYYRFIFTKMINNAGCIQRKLDIFPVFVILSDKIHFLQDTEIAIITFHGFFLEKICGHV